MEIKKRCEHCRVLIKPNEHQVIIITKREGKILEQVYFHINCWAEYFNKTVTNKAKQNVSSVQSNVKGLLDNPMLKGILANIGGIDQLTNMLNTDLITEDLDATMKQLGLSQASKKKPIKKNNKFKKKENGKPKNKN